MRFSSVLMKGVPCSNSWFERGGACLSPQRLAVVRQLRNTVPLILPRAGARQAGRDKPDLATPCSFASSSGLPRQRGVAVTTIGIHQIIVWGTSFYSLAVTGKAIVADTGWSNSLVFAGLTVGLLASSVVSSWAGRAIDRYGARLVMSSGSVVLAASLVPLAYVQNEWAYLATWAVIGLAMRFTLYDAAFAAMVQVAPQNGRLAIAYLTLFGGFASTIFWPIGHVLVEAVGWRETYLIFALVNLVISAPLCIGGLARREPDAVPDNPTSSAAGSGTAAGAAPPLEGRARTIAMALFCLIMSANALVFGVGAVHLVGIIEASGIALATAVAIASFKGVAQVAGRLWELVFGRHIPPVGLGRIAIGLLPIAFVVLLFTTADWTTAALFTLIFGASNGLVTIVRGAVPLALFGAEGYGAVLGLIATPVLLFGALSPLLFALIVDAWDYRTGTWVLFGVALLSLAAMEIMGAWYRRHQQQNVPPTASGTETAP